MVHLQVICIPSNGTRTGPESECISNVLVSPGPGPCPFEKRHKVTMEVLHKDL